MMRRNRRSAYLARKAERLRATVQELADSLYGLDDRDLWLRCENLKSYRVELMRGFVVYIHLALEDLLRALLFDFLRRHNRSLLRKTTIRIVDDLKSADLVHWCGRLKVLSQRQYSDLMELNRIRNACAHNWLFDLSRAAPRAAKVKRRMRAPRVIYKNNNLFAQKTFEDEFCTVYSNLSLKLLFKVWRLQGRL
jgi:hypothetical protein